MDLRHELTQQSVTTFGELKKHLNCNTNAIEDIIATFSLDSPRKNSPKTRVSVHPERRFWVYYRPVFRTYLFLNPLPF